MNLTNTTKRIVFAACVVFITKASAQVIFTDNFTPTPSPLWGNQQGNWKASGGIYYAQSPGNLIYNGNRTATNGMTNVTHLKINTGAASRY